MIIVLVGESASGKSTLADYISKHSSFTKIVTYTTRPPREGEVNGVDYNFISDAEFETLKANGFFIENAVYREWKYGTSIFGHEKFDEIVILTPAGARAFKRCKDVNDDIKIIYLFVDRRSRLIKLLERGDSIEESYRRNLTDVGMFDQFECEADLVIGNFHYKKSVEEIADEIFTYIDKQQE